MLQKIVMRNYVSGRTNSVQIVTSREIIIS
uniref:Uncharacterized protein n=1 Tax=Anguilla anguilla TaxID=7936 RepID=A0A0E9XPU0_ANGAN